MDVAVTFARYRSHAGDDGFSPSGAYVFRRHFVRSFGLDSLHSVTGAHAKRFRGSPWNDIHPGRVEALPSSTNEVCLEWTR